MKYSIDRIENKKIIIQNIETGNLKEISKSELQTSVQEGDIIQYINGQYKIDNKETEKRKKRIREKLEKLKQIQKN